MSGSKAAHHEGSIFMPYE